MASLHNLDLNLLVLFETLMSERHVTRAAERANLSQSAMSHALNRLREQLNDPILVRTDQGMQPTPRAIAMLPAVRQSLKLIERTITPPEKFVPAESERRFVIASTDYFEMAVLPDLVSRLQQIAPRVSIEMELISSRHSAQRLEEHSVDLLVGLDETEEMTSHLIKDPWISEEQVCLVRESNEHVETQLSLEQYVESPHVVFVDLIGGGESSRIDSWLEEQGLARRFVSRNLNYLAAARIVEKTQAIMTLPKQLAILLCQMLPLRLAKPPPGLPALDMTVIYHPFFARRPSTQWLKMQVEEVGHRLLQNREHQKGAIEFPRQKQ